MKHIDYFKLQAKNLLKDYQTKKPYSDGEFTYYEYDPKYFDIDSLLVDYNWDESSLTLMNAQHLIAVLVGFKNWNELLHAPEKRLEMAHLLFDNEDKANLDEWEMYLGNVDIPDIGSQYDLQIEIFKKIFIEGNIRSDFMPYKLDCQEKHREMNPNGTWFRQSHY